ncbi:MAG: hypothetical protein JXX28_03165 [Deltaproteobacteria bacterium]|nr:hypothetical protein [Deltaproteobacteria bacterium]
MTADPHHHSTEPSARPALVATAPPPDSLHQMGPEQVELYVRAGMHQDRTPGNLLVVAHPFRIHKVPRSLFKRLERAGFTVEVVETLADRVQSAITIRDAMIRLHQTGLPLDVLVVTGDGSLDHHVMLAAFWAFYPDLIEERPGTIDCSAVTEEQLSALPPEYRRSFFRRLPDTSGLDPTPETMVELWILRAKLERAVRKGRPVSSLVRRARRNADDPMLQVAVLGILLPEQVVLRPHGFDLRRLAEAPKERIYQGLYPYIRSIAVYPAGTAADNAVFAGVPGYTYSRVAGVLEKLPWLERLRVWAEERAANAFLDYFLRDSVVVPARYSVIGFDHDWQFISSHAAGGPAAGHFFTADLVSKAEGMVGYVLRIPTVLIQEGLLGKTVVKVRSTFPDGSRKQSVDAHLAEGLFTNRTFIAGIGTIPSTDPTSFAGQSSLILVPPMLYRGEDERIYFDISGVSAFTEAIVKGIVARLMHAVGLGTGTLAGGGTLSFLSPENQVSIREGERLEVDYLTSKRRPRAVALQVSGDPFQGWSMQVKAAWGAIPLLGKGDSLLLSSTRRSLNNVRTLQSYRLQGAYIGGLYYFRHHVGRLWNADFMDLTGLISPPLHLPRSLSKVQHRIIEAWKAHDTGDFLDTTEGGLDLGRRGRYAHNNDHTAHLIVIRERKGLLLVRLVRARPDQGVLHETRTWYHRVGSGYIIHQSQTIAWEEGQDPRILQESHYFRDAEAYQQEAPSFFPFGMGSEEEERLMTQEEEIE